MTLAAAMVAAAPAAVVLVLIAASTVSSAVGMLLTRDSAFFYGRSANAYADPSVSEIKQLHNGVGDTER